MGMMDPQILRFTAENEWADTIVRILADAIRASIATTGKCVLGLAGGNTPGPVYETIGQRTDIDWSLAHVFLVDERYVLPSEERSNQGMLRRTLLKHAAIPEAHVHLPDTTLPIGECVASYNREIAELVAVHGVDALVLGMGSDGHIASLFPPLPAEAFGPASVIHTDTLQFSVKDRISVTLPVLEAARERMLLLKGKDKFQAWQEMTLSPPEERMWPLQRLIDSGPLTVIMNEA